MAIKETSEQLCKRIAEKSNGECIISFSCGKDSLAAYIQAKKYFKKVHIVFYYMHPNLTFQQDYIKYFTKITGLKVWQYPSPKIAHWFIMGFLQTPSRIDYFWELDITTIDYDFLFNMARLDIGCPIDTPIGIGVRQNDSLTRRMSIAKYGAENIKRKQFFPVFDWDKTILEKEILSQNIRLPIDYKIWGRSFDSLQIEFTLPLKKYFPLDYEKLKDFYPLIETNIIRFNNYHNINEKTIL